jgi:hypothetical protein
VFIAQLLAEVSQKRNPVITIDKRAASNLYAFKGGKKADAKCHYEDE